MSKKITISAKIPAQTHHDMLVKIIQDGYGMKGKSKWIHEAIERLLMMHDYSQFVDIASEIDDLSAVVTFRVDNEFISKMDQAVIAVRKMYPAMEGVQSNIVRASIFQRLINS